MIALLAGQCSGDDMEMICRCCKNQEGAFCLKDPDDPGKGGKCLIGSGQSEEVTDCEWNPIVQQYVCECTFGGVPTPCNQLPTHPTVTECVTLGLGTFEEECDYDGNGQ